MNRNRWEWFSPRSALKNGQNSSRCSESTQIGSEWPVTLGSNQTDKARAAFQRTAELAEEELRINPRDTNVLITLADAYSMLNRGQRARKLLEKAMDLAPNDISDVFQASVVYEQLGDRKRALECITRAIKGGYSRDLIEKAPSLTQLRSDPRFQGLFGP